MGDGQLSRKDIIISIGVLLTCISVIIGGYLIGKAIKEANTMEADNNITSKVMDLPMVADYLNMTQGEVRAIIRLEEEQISEYGSFTGKMFPYFTIDNNGMRLISG